jgi:hypothetical protein
MYRDPGWSSSHHVRSGQLRISEAIPRFKKNGLNPAGGSMISPFGVRPGKCWRLQHIMLSMLKDRAVAHGIRS